MKKFLAFLLFLCGCEKPYTKLDAYYDEAAARGYSKEKLDSIAPGMIMKYECGCEWTVSHFQYGYPVPPPLLCHKHNSPQIGCLWEKDWKAEQE